METVREKTRAEPIGSRSAFAYKTGPSGEKTRHKATFVKKFYLKVPGRVYNKTFSPTTRLSKIRVLISYVVCRDNDLKQMVIKSANFKADI